MTVKELIEALQQQPQEAEAWVATACHGCFERVNHVELDKRGMVVVDSGPPQSGEME